MILVSMPMSAIIPIMEEVATRKFLEEREEEGVLGKFVDAKLKFYREFKDPDGGWASTWEFRLDFSMKEDG